MSFKRTIKKEDGMSVMKNTKEKMSRKALEEVVAAALEELTRRRAALAQAEEGCTFAEAKAARGGWSEKRAFRMAEDAVERLEEAVIEAESALREREAELVNCLAESEEASGAASSRWMKAARKRALELGAALQEKREEELSIGKELVALALEAEARTPLKLVARRSQRIVRVEVLDEAIKGLRGEEMSMEFFTARRAAELGKVRIIPSAALELRPEDIEYQQRSVPLPGELEAIRNINLGTPFPSEDAREAFDFNRIEAMLTDNEKAAAVKAVEGGA